MNICFSWKKKKAISEFAWDSLLKRVLVQNLPHENEFDLNENEPAIGNTFSQEKVRIKSCFATEVKD